MRIATGLSAQEHKVTGPDGHLAVQLSVQSGKPVYTVSYKGKVFLEPSPLGLQTNVGDFSTGMKITGSKAGKVDESYTLNRGKASRIHYKANELTVTLENEKKQSISLCFRVSNNDIAFRYLLPKQGETASIIVRKESTGFDFPGHTTTFLTPQSDAMIGWKRTKPSYEEKYHADAPMDKPSQFGKGYTFPGLFRIGNDGWVLVSETGVDSRYCGSRLSEHQSGGLYTIAFPMPEENNGNGTAEPAFALPGATPWRTITVGETPAPIVETTIPWDVVKPLYKTTHHYKFGKGTWSWILWQDRSINYDDQMRYVDLAAAMNFQYVLIDNWWDKNIGHERMEKLIKYAQGKGVDVFLWYSSSGYWNDIEQGPVNLMDNPIVRKREMKWLKSQGVKGIKVDFFGGDKQETIRLYEAILSDADDHGLMVIFHGCTLPRGWERMYPNFVGSEAVLASENLVFNQQSCDEEAFNACLHPFIRNTVGSMEFGGTFLNKRLNRGNDGGSTRRTTDAFQLATAVLFQNPIQNFALAPNNLGDAPPVALDFLKEVPVTWDETRYISGYPGKYVVLARRHGNTWYVAGINAEKQPLKLKLDLSMLAGQKADIYHDEQIKKDQITIKKNGIMDITIAPQGGFVITGDTPLSAQDSAYLFTYFTGNSRAGEAIRFAISRDGYHFSALNNNEPVILSEKISSTGGVRDPHILRGADGKTFYMVVTDMVSANGWNSNRAMVLLKSRDLVNWTSSVVNIQKRFPGNEDLLRVWAPQTIYDPVAKKYMVYWSMKHGKDPDKIYYAYANADFTGLETAPEQLFFSPANGACIDGDIVFKDGKYHLFFKTEGDGAGIKVAVSDRLTGGYKLIDKYVQQTKDPVEGAGVFKLNGKNEYILMYDVYTKGRYQFTRTTDLENFTVVDEEVTMDFHPRHGTVMSITATEAARLMKKWGTGR